MSDICTLSDGRDLGYAQYGDENGAQIFYLHGLPGSRLEGSCWRPAFMAAAAWRETEAVRGEPVGESGRAPSPFVAIVS